MIKKFIHKTGIALAVLPMLAGMGCRKTEFGTISEPAYIRVFNCLDRTITLENKDAPQPLLTMLIDPVLDKDGVPESAAVTGDFLDVRDSWARPYPDAANTNLYQKEYPGAAKVMAAPILNGYDLSSWAQVESGKRRLLFLTRPMNTVPFFSLEKHLRTSVLLDTTIDLSQGEVYTMHVLQKDYLSRKNMLYVRNETFVKQSLSDSLVYVNFYNLSSAGFFKNAPATTNTGSKVYKLTDSTSIFYTLRRVVGANMVDIPSFTQVPMGTMTRSLDPVVTRYYSFPLFADTGTNRIYPGEVQQVFEFFKSGYIAGIGTSGMVLPNNLPDGHYLALATGGPNLGRSYGIHIQCDVRSGMIVTERSGIYNPRYFATVNTVEVINSKIFVTTIQRRFDPPVY